MAIPAWSNKFVAYSTVTHAGIGGAERANVSWKKNKVQKLMWQVVLQVKAIYIVTMGLSGKADGFKEAREMV